MSKETENGERETRERERERESEREREVVIERHKSGMLWSTIV